MAQLEVTSLIRSPKRILVVDDEEDLQQFVRFILEDVGYEVMVAGNGREGLRRIASDLPDLVILDLMMPEVDGWKVLQALRELATPHPRVVVLSAHADAPAAFEAGAAECLSKPFDINQLLATCERLLSN